MTRWTAALILPFALVALVEPVGAIGLPSKKDIEQKLGKVFKAAAGACGSFVGAVSSKYDPAQYFLDQVSPSLGRCQSDFRKGFLCGLPDAVFGLAGMMGRIVGAIWEHKKCLLLGPNGMGACGAYYVAKDGVKKLSRCFKALKNTKAKAIVKALWRGAKEYACSAAGGVTADVVIAALTDGASAPSALAKWLGKLSTLLSKLSPSQLAGLGGALGKGLDHAVGVAKSAVKEACR